MTWFGWVFITYYVVNAIIDIGMIGKVWRITPEVVVIQLTFYFLLVWGALTVGITR